jgi:hypothetical protein
MGMKIPNFIISIYCGRYGIAVHNIEYVTVESGGITMHKTNYEIVNKFTDIDEHLQGLTYNNLKKFPIKILKDYWHWGKSILDGLPNDGTDCDEYSDNLVEIPAQFECLFEESDHNGEKET